MIETTKLETSELGHTFDFGELRNKCRAVWGGFAVPGKRQGFAMVVGMDKKKHFDSHDVYLLDEFESFDMRELVRQCGVLDFKYHITFNDYQRTRVPDRWIGDYKNKAASRFIQEMNKENYEDKHDDAMSQRHFSLNSTPIMEMNTPYQFILPKIRELLKRQQLFLKESKILNYLRQIEESEMAELEFGAYPAIEALSFTVIEMRNYVAQQKAMASLPRNNDPYRGWNVLNGVRRRK